MNDEGITLAGWPAVRIFLMVAIAQVLTALIMSLPIAWLIEHVFAIGALDAIFGVQRFGYWRVVGLFGIWFAIRTRIKVHGRHK